MSNTDVRVMYTEDDLMKVQTKTNLYIQKYGNHGCFHLFKEAAQNSIDEYVDPGFEQFLKSTGEKDKKRVIKIIYDRLIDRITIEDDGRGIPEEDYPIDIVCTKLQSGSKFFRDQGGNSSGEFGVGLTVVCALSTEFTLATYRNSYYHKISFKNAKKVSDERKDIKKGGKKHGTIASFIIDQKYLGVGAHIPIDMCIEWMEMMSYQVDEKIEFIVEEYEGVKLINTTKIKKKPFSELIYKFISDQKSLSLAPISFIGKGVHEETIVGGSLDKNGKASNKAHKMKKNVKLEFAFAYNDSMENEYISFCNFTKTDDGGIHIDAVEDALCRFLQQAARNSLTQAQQAKWSILYADVKAGLKLVVNLSTNAQVQFMGNAKNKIQNESLKPVLKDIAYQQISQYFEKDPGKLSAVCKIIVSNARARIEMQKVKSVSVRKKTDVFHDFEISNFISANNRKRGEYRELFLVEGQRSAAGSMVDGRDAATQAIFGFRGVTANPFKCSFAEIMENAEWKNYVEVLRTGIGKDFDINRLFYDKIIISTDADVDGYGISVGICAFHVMYLPEIIETGHLYKVYPPLYHIDNKGGAEFIRSKPELVEIYLKKISKTYKLRIIHHKSDYLSKDDMWDFLYDTIEYRDILTSLYDFYKIEKGLIEVVTAALVGAGGITMIGNEPMIKEGIFEDQKFIRNFMQEIQKAYPESTLHGCDLESVAGGRINSVRINSRFVKKVEDLIPIYMKYGYKVGAKEKNCEDRVMTIGEFLDDSYRLTPKILMRYKGLGEANADQLWDTTLNPANRILTRLTFDSIERDMEIFKKLKSDKLIYRKQRKEMMESYKIARGDLDT